MANYNELLAMYQELEKRNQALEQELISVSHAANQRMAARPLAVKVQDMQDALKGISAQLNTTLKEHKSQPWARAVERALAPY
jgi:hypothetical protein